MFVGSGVVYVDIQPLQHHHYRLGASPSKIEAN